MSSPDANPFDLVPPRRPSADDFNGIAKKDEEGRVPNAKTQPNAPEWNTIEHVLLAVSRVMPVLVISVTGDATTPTVYGVVNATTHLGSSDFVPTHHATGDVEVNWPASSFPTPAVNPAVAVNGSADGRAVVRQTTNGFRVLTFDSAGAAADLDFTVTQY